MKDKTTGVVFWFVVGLIATAIVYGAIWSVFKGYSDRVQNEAPKINPITVEHSAAVLTENNDRLIITL